MRLLVIDNHDSFTLNLVHLLDGIGVAMDLLQASEVKFRSLESYTHLLIGPGPGRPQDADDLHQLLHDWPADRPLLGVCLGMQCLMIHCGADPLRYLLPEHGAQTDIHVLKSHKLLADLPLQFTAGRYHSWYFDAQRELPEGLEILAVDENQHVMAMALVDRNWHGVQFHPESIMTTHGRQLLANFVAL